MTLPLHNKKHLNSMLFIIAVSFILIFTSCNAIETIETNTSTPKPTQVQLSTLASPSLTPEESPQGIGNKNAGADLVSTATPELEKTEMTSTEEATVEVNNGDVDEFTSSQFGKTAIENFSLSNSNEIAPEDILQEISYSSGAGGDPICQESYAEPTVVATPTEGFLNEVIKVNTCGWQNGKKVNISLTYPDGRVTEQEQVDEVQYTNSALLYELKTNVLNDVPGSYLITFTGSNQVLQHEILLSKPINPQFYWDDNSLILYNFAPNEAVRIFAYQSTSDAEGTGHAELTAWQGFNVDGEGNLVLQLNEISGTWFNAIGEISGEIQLDYHSSPSVYGMTVGSVIKNTTNEIPTKIATWPISDTGIEACHLTIGEFVTSAENARLWSQPDVISSSVVSSPEQGQSLLILAGPNWGPIRRDIDASGWWWQVSLSSSNESGWLWENRIIECTN